MSQRRCPRRATGGGCFARLRFKYGWCCRSKRQARKTIQYQDDDLVPFNPLGQLISWAIPSRRVTRPVSGTREVSSLSWNAAVVEHGSGRNDHDHGESYDTMMPSEERPPLLHSIARDQIATSSAISSPTAIYTPASDAAVDFAAACDNYFCRGITRSPGVAGMTMPGVSGKTEAIACSGHGSVIEGTKETFARVTKRKETRGELESTEEADGADITDMKVDVGRNSGVTIDSGGDESVGVMVPMIGQDEEVEAASFMPRAFRSITDTVMRKWQAEDLETTALDAEIGGGTFARVVHGQTSLGTPVAIKIIARDSEDFGCQDKYINREIEALTMTADHPNVVEIVGTLKTAHTTFMIMPLIDTDAARLLKVLHESDVVLMAFQLMSALDHVHGKNIVHRDLKPANLLVTQDMQVRLADFGFAKMLEQEGGTMTGLCGTKVNNLPYGTAADMWAAGVVVYELLMGVTAFCPDSSIDLGPVAFNTSAPKDGDIRMRLDPYDELERENIRAGVFEVDSGRVGAVGEDFLRKLILLDPAERMSARQAGEQAWFGGAEQASLKRAGVEAATKERHEAQEEEKKERTQLLRSRRRRRVPKMVKTARAPAPVAEGTSQSTASDSTAGATSTLTTASAKSSPAAGVDIPRAMIIGGSEPTVADGQTAVDGASGAGENVAVVAV